MEDAEEARDRARRKMERKVARERRKLERSERRLRRRYGSAEGDSRHGGPPPPPADPGSDESASASAADLRYAAARRSANLKVSVAIHAIAYAMVMALLLRVAGFRVMMIVALGWGIGLAVHYFVAFILPDLRHRWIRDAVDQGVEAGVHHQRRSAQTRRARSLENLSASIAHEIRNPVSAAKSLVQQMGEDPVSSENIRYAGVALEELDRVERSISHLLRFARDEEIRFEPVQLAEVVDSALQALGDRLAELPVKVSRQFDTPGPMRGDFEQLRRVVLNLVSNAVDACADTSGARVDVMVGQNLACTETWLRVRDNGPGIPADEAQKIFDPFYSTKHHGTGLGLALTKKIVEAHAGEMELRSDPDSGCEFAIHFPAPPAEGEPK